jgi:hypothetical protein
MPVSRRPIVCASVTFGFGHFLLGVPAEHRLTKAQAPMCASDAVGWAPGREPPQLQLAVPRYIPIHRPYFSKLLRVLTIPSFARFPRVMLRAVASAVDQVEGLCLEDMTSGDISSYVTNS